MSVDCPTLGIRTVELQGTGVNVAPGGCVVAIESELTTEVKDMFAANHGHYVGRIEDHFLVGRVGGWLNPGIGIVAQELNRGKDVGFGKLPTDLAGMGSDWDEDRPG